MQNDPQADQICHLRHWVNVGFPHYLFLELFNAFATRLDVVNRPVFRREEDSQ